MLTGHRQETATLHQLQALDERAVSASSALGKLIRQLPSLASHGGGIDFSGSHPEDLVAVAGAAEAVVQNAHSGLQAVGMLLASLHDEAAQQKAASALPGLGVLVAELSALASHCSDLAADCRRETLDYAPSALKALAGND